MACAREARGHRTRTNGLTPALTAGLLLGPFQLALDDVKLSIVRVTGAGLLGPPNNLSSVDHDDDGTLVAVQQARRLLVDVRLRAHGRRGGI